MIASTCTVREDRNGEEIVWQWKMEEGHDGQITAICGHDCMHDVMIRCHNQAYDWRTNN